MSRNRINFQNTSFLKSAAKAKGYPPPTMPEVAVLGRSNVGKSSLLNSVFERRSLVKVSRTPGRTQLINFFNVNDELCLVDLPGYGFAKVPEKIRRQWRPMIETYLEKRENLLGCMLLLDMRRNPSEDDVNMWEWLQHYDLTAIPVLTKSDKLSGQQRRNQKMRIAKALDVPMEALIVTSAKTHAGRDRLRDVLQGLCWSITEEDIVYEADEEIDEETE